MALTQNTRQKGSPIFSADRYTVIARDGAKIIVQSDRVQYSRNAQDVKKVPIMLQNGTDQSDAEETEIPIPSNADEPSPALLPEIPTEEMQVADRVLGRPKRSAKKPSRFNDMVLYYIYD